MRAELIDAKLPIEFWDEAVEALRAQPRGEHVEPRALGFGEQRAGNVEAHGAARYRSDERGWRILGSGTTVKTWSHRKHWSRWRSS